MPVRAALRILLVVAAAVAAASASPAQGFAACVPAALLLAAIEPTARRGLAAAALAILAVGAVARPGGVVAALAPVLGVGVLLAVRARLERERDAMRGVALRDPLTGLSNRRALDEVLAHEIARHERAGEAFVVLALDLDGFKGVNDHFGHDAGDEVLRDTARALVQAVRAQDTVVRLGGDEFCVLAPQTDPEGADVLADRVRASLASVTAGLRGLSASLGAASFPADGADAAALLAAADAAAVQAKRHRRRARAA